MPAMPNGLIRAAGCGVILTSLWYLPWLLANLNLQAPLVSLPFAVATIVLIGSCVLTAINNWNRCVPSRRTVRPGAEPAVVVIIPTCGESVEMIERTTLSVLRQDYPIDQILVLIGDDAGNLDLDAMAARIPSIVPGGQVLVYRAPRRGDPARRGEAKSGNLNAALDVLDAWDPAGVVAYVETRDADDLVGDPAFLQQCVGQLEDDLAVGFVQTIKEAQTADGDPFGNTDRMFFRGSMFARNAANAVFPCGSGLVWRRQALEDIGGFPSWNLVEDLQSGVEALRRGWRGLYLPIVGAYGQIAPEDIPNVYKQRGTWALDTVRLLVWGQWRGLTIRQRMHFFELGMFYLYGTAFLVFCLAPVAGLVFETYPVATSQLAHAAHFWPITIAIELFLLALNRGGRWEDLWRARQMWVGMAPIYARQSLRAIGFGPRRKPVYRVTRKNHEHRWYWRETLPQVAVAFILTASIAVAVTRGSVLADADLGSVYWAMIGMSLLTGFIAKGWFGVAGRSRAPSSLPVEVPLPPPLLGQHLRPRARPAAHAVAS